MSFFASSNGKGFEAGYFLVSDEKVERRTTTIAQNHAQVVTRADGSKYVPAGAVIPANGSTAKGLLYEDTDVTNGAAAGSIVTRGTVYEDRLPASVESDAKTALTGLVFVSAEPAIARPVFNRKTLTALTVASAAGATSGKTALTVTGYTMSTGEKYYYKAASGTAPAVVFGLPLDDTWTVWDGSSDLTVATGKKLTLAAVDTTGAVVAAGNCTVTAKT